MLSGKLSKSDKLAQIDHSQIDYPPFRKNFYIEVRCCHPPRPQCAAVCACAGVILGADGAAGMTSPCALTL